MASPTGFINIDRDSPKTRKVAERILDYKEIYTPTDDNHVKTQSARCMDCGVPFCHNGCPLGNVIPDFNDAVYKENWLQAYEILSSTNNFPEFTGRICPAPCETSCVLGINNDAVAIEYIEKSIIEKAFEKGYVKRNNVTFKTGKKVAVVGSGPAGLAAADQLNKAGHDVTVYEKSDKIGGLLRNGIPDFKLEKWVIDRRVSLMEESGIKFISDAHIGENIKTSELTTNFDAIVLCCGSNVPRDINIECREANGIHFAMDYLEHSNKFVSGLTENPFINVMNKNVIVIGGGDTGADCVGTANRQGAKNITQLEITAMPSLSRTQNNPWPQWPLILRTSSSHHEGCNRQWSILTKSFTKNENGNLTGINTVQVKWDKDENGKYGFIEIDNSHQWLEADYVFIAAGFLYTNPNGMVQDMNLTLDDRGNILTNKYQTSTPNIFAAGDMRRGQSLVVWAIAEGREAAVEVDKFLSGSDRSILEMKDVGVLVI